MVGYRPLHYHQQFLDEELLPELEPQPPTGA